MPPGEQQLCWATEIGWCYQGEKLLLVASERKLRHLRLYQTNVFYKTASIRGGILFKQNEIRRHFMFRTITICLLGVFALSLQAQDEAAAPAEEEPEAVVDWRLSYALGMETAESLKTQEKLESRLFQRGFRDALDGEELLLTQEQAQEIRQGYYTELQSAAIERAAAANLEQSRAILAENAQAEGVTTTESGLQYIVLEQGQGERPADSDTVQIHYIVYRIDGTPLENTYENERPATSEVKVLIPGWREGLKLMGVGGKSRFFIPPELAYGAEGRPPAIGPNMALIADIELLAKSSVDNVERMSEDTKKSIEDQL
ncbi:MAG: FKBP-type peptidyl-prolyl cis-trans isomerase N-terminal domain-containing protein [Lentisphaeria bacterium]|nr:FKBP-type peptidyl-prolyl cis-trans isomerase N-terminal domain-containing protein [Lentisphaeria bacterium]